LIEKKELYRSPNGDRWLLCSDPDAEHVFVRHEANAPSGGQVTEIEIRAFLSGGNGPEHQALLRLIGTPQCVPTVPFLPSSGSVIAILPSNDLDRSEQFYSRLGFTRVDREKTATGEANTYRILTNRTGGSLHLTAAEDGWLVPGKNPFGLYLYREDVDALAAALGSAALGSGPEDKPWGMYEFTLSDPDETLVRVGWPSRPTRST
jgi:catechol 2,3-dioxygenase-like lactoylglutathione lyase family enzyme